MTANSLFTVLLYDNLYLFPMFIFVSLFRLFSLLLYEQLYLDLFNIYYKLNLTTSVRYIGKRKTKNEERKGLHRSCRENFSFKLRLS